MVPIGVSLGCREALMNGRANPIDTVISGASTFEPRLRGAAP